MATVRAVWFGAVALLLSLAPPAKADILFESATPVFSGPWTSSISGVSAGFGFISGFNFEVTTPVHVTDIGGDFGIGFPTGNNQLFGAIAPAPGLISPPNPPDLSSNVLGTTLIPLPSNFPTANVSGNLSLDLSPGIYAVLFGSQKFGATGDATAVIFQDGQQANIPVPGVFTYAIRQSDGAFLPQGSGPRYFVEGTVIGQQPPAVPEPSAVFLFGAGLAVLGVTLRKRKAARE
jgi:hypothetical protein